MRVMGYEGNRQLAAVWKRNTRPVYKTKYGPPRGCAGRLGMSGRDKQKKSPHSEEWGDCEGRVWQDLCRQKKGSVAAGGFEPPRK